MKDSLIANARATVESALRECRSHVEKMERAASALSNRFPLTGQTLKELDGDSVARLDQFIYRFTKLQDSMATRLLRALDTIVRADDSPRPFLDMLSDMEKLGLVPAEADWQFFRGLRNNLAHDYPESVEQTASTLNVLFKEWRRFAEILPRADAYYRKLFPDFDGDLG